MRARGVVKVIANGNVEFDNDFIEVENADDAVIIFTESTSYNGFDKDAVKDGKDYKSICKNTIDKAALR